MARNHEKHYGRLNRLWLQKEQEVKELKNPPRPRLQDLSSAAEIRKWLPSIKQEIDFCLKQSQVPCYTDKVADEYRDKVDRLVKQYKSHVRKMRQLDPEMKDSCTPRPYCSKYRKKPEKQPDCVSSSHDQEEVPPAACNFDSRHQLKQMCETSDNTFIRIYTPLLEQEPCRSAGQECVTASSEIRDTVNKELQDTPLVFQQREDLKSKEDLKSEEEKNDGLKKLSETLNDIVYSDEAGKRRSMLLNIFGISEENYNIAQEVYPRHSAPNSLKREIQTAYFPLKKSQQSENVSCETESAYPQNKLNPLGLDYSSPDEDSD